MSKKSKKIDIRPRQAARSSIFYNANGCISVCFYDKLCEDFGMSMSTAINVFARAVVRERRIPFDVASADAPAYAADRRVFYNANPVASRMLRTMQQLSADAEKAGSAGMTLDEINAEIAAARSGK